MTHEYWCILLYTIQVKDTRKRAATKIKNIASDRSDYLSDSGRSVRIPRNKKARFGTGVIRSKKVPNNKVPEHHGTQRQCVLFKKAGMPGRKYMAHSAEFCFENHNNQKTTMNGLSGPMGGRSEAVKQYKNYKIKRKKY